MHLAEPDTKWGQQRQKEKKEKKTKTQEEERQKKKMPILNRISTIKVLFAILWDWQLAKVVLAAYNSQAQYLQLYHRVKYLQPGGGNQSISPTSSHVPAWQSEAKQNIIPAQGNLKALG